MNWKEVITVLIANAPEIISTVTEGIAWAQKTWEEWKTSTGRDESTVTVDELLAHIAHFKRSSEVIQQL